MQIFSISPYMLFLNVVKDRGLIFTLIKREIIGRYRGSLFGLLWSFFNPLLMLAVYTFVFNNIFKARWATASSSQGEFALVLFSGLMIFSVFSEAISRAPGLITANTNLVKKVVFPLEILPIVSVCSALFHFMISFLVWLLAYWTMLGTPPETIFYLPVVLMPLILLSLGLSWMLASLGTYFRDLTQIIGIIITAAMFLSPIFYPSSSLPEDYQFIMLLNPLTNIIEQTRDVLIWAKPIDWITWSFSFVMTTVLALCGFAWFQKTRKGFADVL